METIQLLFSNGSIRPEQILHLGTMCLHDRWPTLANDAFAYDLDSVSAALGLPELAAEITGDPDPEQLFDVLRIHGKHGWLVQFATPFPKGFWSNGDSRGYHYSWGHTATHWIYGESFDECCRAALQWRDEYIEGRRLECEQESQQQEAQP